MAPKSAIIATIAIFTTFRILIGVLLLTAQAEMTTLALRWIFVISGLWLIAYAILRAVRGWIAFDKQFAKN